MSSNPVADASPGGAREEDPMNVATRMDQALEHAVERGDVPGVVALAADRHGVIYQGAFGRRNAGTSASVSRWAMPDVGSSNRITRGS